MRYGDVVQDAGNRVDVECGREFRQIGEARFEFVQRALQHVQFGGVDHASGPFREGRQLTVKTPATA
jgi:hypothetical protein